jgi:hypothetical protein
VHVDPLVVGGVLSLFRRRGRRDGRSDAAHDDVAVRGRRNDDDKRLVLLLPLLLIIIIS